MACGGAFFFGGGFLVSRATMFSYGVKAQGSVLRCLWKVECVRHLWYLKLWLHGNFMQSEKLHCRRNVHGLLKLNILSDCSLDLVMKLFYTFNLFCVKVKKSIA